jgi:cupin 2 domain-containing protein
VIGLTVLQNIFSNLPDASVSEIFQTIAQNGVVRIERIISHGQITPEGEWFDQELDEWVLLLSGSAELFFENNATPLPMNPGDYVLIAARQRHRVVWTDPNVQTVWLAVHFPSSIGNS